MKKILYFFGSVLILFIIQLLLFSISLRTNLFYNVTIYYYRIVYINIIITLFIFFITIITLIFIKKYNFLINQYFLEIICAFLIVFLSIFSMISIFSMPVDRSYTIYSIAVMAEEENNTFTESDIEKAFIDGYIIDMGATKRRISEQVSIGNIEETEGGYKITSKGSKLINYMRMYEKFFPVSEKRILYPNEEY